MKTLIHRAGMAAALLLTPLMVQAADHLDGPQASAMPAADINDVLAWMSADAESQPTLVNLVMTVWPNAGPMATFSDSVIYTFHTGSAAGYGQAETSSNIECTFDATQNITCTVGDVTVTGDASSETGIMSPNGDVKVFAGLRNDPFFFNLRGFQNATSTVATVAQTLTADDLDSDGFPTALTAAQAMLVAGQLSGNPDDEDAAAEDFFANFNTLAIVLQVDKDLLTAGGSILSVWGSTQLVSE